MNDLKYDEDYWTSSSDSSLDSESESGSIISTPVFSEAEETKSIEETDTKTTSKKGRFDIYDPFKLSMIKSSLKSKFKDTSNLTKKDKFLHIISSKFLSNQFQLFRIHLVSINYLIISSIIFTSVFFVYWILLLKSHISSFNIIIMIITFLLSLVPLYVLIYIKIKINIKLQLKNKRILAYYESLLLLGFTISLNLILILKISNGPCTQRQNYIDNFHCLPVFYDGFIAQRILHLDNIKLSDFKMYILSDQIILSILFLPLMFNVLFPFIPILFLYFFNFFNLFSIIGYMLYLNIIDPIKTLIIAFPVVIFIQFFYLSQYIEFFFLSYNFNTLIRNKRQLKKLNKKKKKYLAKLSKKKREEEMNNVIISITHDLKSPLTAFHFGIENIKNNLIQEIFLINKLYKYLEKKYINKASKNFIIANQLKVPMTNIIQTSSTSSSSSSSSSSSKNNTRLYNLLLNNYQKNLTTSSSVSSAPITPTGKGESEVSSEVPSLKISTSSSSLSKLASPNFYLSSSSSSSETKKKSLEMNKIGKDQKMKELRFDLSERQTKSESSDSLFKQEIIDQNNLSDSTDNTEASDKISFASTMMSKDINLSIKKMNNESFQNIKSLMNPPSSPSAKKSTSSLLKNEISSSSIISSPYFYPSSPYFLPSNSSTSSRSKQESSPPYVLPDWSNTSHYKIKKKIDNNIEEIKETISNLIATYQLLNMTINRTTDFNRINNNILLKPNREIISLMKFLKEPIDLSMQLQKRISVRLELLIGNLSENKPKFHDTMKDEKNEFSIGTDHEPIAGVLDDYIKTDRQWLFDNLLCLVSNAIKFSNKGVTRVRVSLVQLFDCYKKNEMNIDVCRDSLNKKELSQEKMKKKIINLEETKDMPKKKKLFHLFETDISSDEDYFEDFFMEKKKKKKSKISKLTDSNGTDNYEENNFSGIIKHMEYDPNKKLFFYKHPDSKKKIVRSSFGGFDFSFLDVKENDEYDEYDNINENEDEKNKDSTENNANLFNNAKNLAKKIMDMLNNKETLEHKESKSDIDELDRLEKNIPSFRAKETDEIKESFREDHEYESKTNIPILDTPKMNFFANNLHKTFLELKKKGSIMDEKLISQLKKKFIKIEVIDNGQGISLEESLRLFHAPITSHQRKEGGVGLGLFCLAERIKALEGMYGLRPREDGEQGAIFWFAIPYEPILSSDLDIKDSRDLSLPPLYPTSEKGRSLSMEDQVSIRNQAIYRNLQLKKEKNLKILVVDDSISILKVVSKMLTSQGHFVETAHNGLAAVEIIKKSLFSNDENKKKKINLKDLSSNDGSKSTVIQNQIDSSLVLNTLNNAPDLNNNESTLPESFYFSSKIEEEENDEEVIESEENIFVYDVILMDLQMPVMDGFEAVKEIRKLEHEFNERRKKKFNLRYEKLKKLKESKLSQEKKDATSSDEYISGSSMSLSSEDEIDSSADKLRELHSLIVAVSANNDQSAVEKSYKSGVDSFISKPFTLSTFNRVVYFGKSNKEGGAQLVVIDEKKI